MAAEQRGEASRMVLQVVRVPVREDRRERWLELIRENAQATRNEDGCERYQVCEDIETPGTFVIVEQWTGLDAQYAHFRNPGFQELLGSLGDVLAGPPEVSIHDVAATQSLEEALAAAGVEQP
jgi:quinol monooxygenase YgiN